jgi:UDP-GlcNAc3NAcA epimerase
MPYIPFKRSISQRHCDGATGHFDRLCIRFVPRGRSDENDMQVLFPEEVCYSVTNSCIPLPQNYSRQMKKILSIAGARPQFIKHAALQRWLQKRFRAVTLHTGQHYDANMSDIFFAELNIPAPEFQLKHTERSSHGAQTAVMLTGIEKALISEKPDALLVYGDTNSTLAGALAAAKLHVPVIHVEAGMRGYNRQVPEEINRLLTDHVSDFLFCPTRSSVENLQKEGIVNGVFCCGDIMTDIFYLSLPLLKEKMQEPYYFATIHRPYNTDSKERMLQILDAMQRLKHKVVFAIHPRTSGLLHQYGVDTSRFSNIIFIPPVGYLDSLSWQKGASAVITDSGGMQKEAYLLRKKCVVIRTETEWTEALETGWTILLFDRLNELQEVIGQPAKAYIENIFGDGHTAEYITDMLVKNL